MLKGFLSSSGNLTKLLQHFNCKLQKSIRTLPIDIFRVWALHSTIHQSRCSLRHGRALLRLRWFVSSHTDLSWNYFILVSGHNRIVKLGVWIINQWKSEQVCKTSLIDGRKKVKESWIFFSLLMWILNNYKTIYCLEQMNGIKVLECGSGFQQKYRKLDGWLCDG